MHVFGRNEMTCWYVISDKKVYEFGSINSKIGPDWCGYRRYISFLCDLLQDQTPPARLDVYYNKSCIIMVSTTRHDLSGHAQFQPVETARFEWLVKDLEDGSSREHTLGKSVSLYLHNLLANESVQKFIYTTQGMRNNRFDEIPRLEVMYRLDLCRQLGYDETGRFPPGIQETVGPMMRRVGVVGDPEWPGCSLYNAVQHCMSATYRRQSITNRRRLGRAYRSEIEEEEDRIEDIENVNIVVFAIESDAPHGPVIVDRSLRTIMLVRRKDEYEPMGIQRPDGSFQFEFTYGADQELLDRVIACPPGPDAKWQIGADFRTFVRATGDMASYTRWELDHLYAMGDLGSAYTGDYKSPEEQFNRIRRAQRIMLYGVSGMCEAYGFTQEASEYVLQQYCSWCCTIPTRLITPRTDFALFYDVVAVFCFVLLHGGFENGNEELFFRSVMIEVNDFRVQFNAERKMLAQYMVHDDEIVDVSMSDRNEQLVSQYPEGKCPDQICPECVLDPSTTLHRAGYLLASYNRWPQEEVRSWIYHPDLDPCLLQRLGGIGLLRGVDRRAQEGARHRLTTPLKIIHQMVQRQVRSGPEFRG
jgi:hypothetical protein